MAIVKCDQFGRKGNIEFERERACTIYACEKMSFYTFMAPADLLQEPV